MPAACQVVDPDFGLITGHQQAMHERHSSLALTEACTRSYTERQEHHGRTQTLQAIAEMHRIGQACLRLWVVEDFMPVSKVS